MSTPKIILASGSQSRRNLLAAAGVDAESIRPNVDEDAVKTAMRAENAKVRDQAMALAELKAEKVSRTHPGLVIGGDQMLSLGTQAFDKPVDRDDARNHLVTLSGKTHHLETAIAIAENGQIIWRHLVRPALTMRTLSEPFIESYLDQVGDEILQTVGGYQLESRGVQLFSKIEGDYFSILGLPLLPLLEYLRERGALER